MVQYSRPGVYVQEINSNPSITGVPTNIPVFIGVAANPANQGEAVMITSWDAYQRTFGGFMWEGYLPFAVYSFFNEGGTQCYVVNAKQDSSSNAAAASGKSTPVTFAAASTGEWGNDLSVYVSPDTPGSSSSGASSGASASPPFKVQVLLKVPKPPSGGSGSGGSSDGNSGGKAKEPTGADLRMSAYVAINKLKPQAIDSGSFFVLETFNGFSSAAAMAAKINNASFFIRVTDGETSTDPVKPGSTQLASGASGTWDFAGDDVKSVVDKILDFSLIALPDNVLQDDTSKQMSNINIWLEGAAPTAASTTQPYFVVADSPYGMDPQTVIGYKEGTSGGNGLNSAFGALYYPWLWFVNPLSGAKTIMPPSGIVLGRYAYTDDTIGVWKAPAGTVDGQLQMITDVNYTITDNDNGPLNLAGVNCIRSMINYGILIWGARTLSTEQEWVYVNVRRLFNFLETSISRSLQWVVFEPNSPKLWTLVTRDISGFLRQMWQDGALFGATAEEAFFVTCNASNNPPESINAGELIVDIGVAAVRPAEFVILRFSQKTLS